MELSGSGSGTGGLVVRGDYVYFDSRVFRQPGNLDGGPGWRRRGEVRRIRLVHGGEIVHVGEEDGSADDMVEAGAAGLEDLADILKDAVGLDADVAGDDLAGGRIDWHLA